jgi:hypothetical protein
MDPHISDIETAIARMITNPATAPTLDRVCAAAFRDLGCSSDPGRQAFFRYMLRNMRLREQLRSLSDASDVDAIIARAEAERCCLAEGSPPARICDEHLRDATGGETGTLADILVSLGGSWSFGQEQAATAQDTLPKLELREPKARRSSAPASHPGNSPPRQPQPQS